MLIPINERFRIASDARQWMIQKARRRNGRTVWQSKYYFGTFEGAVKDLGELMVRESEARTLVDALDDVEKVTTTLSQALTPQLEDILDVLTQDRGR